MPVRVISSISPGFPELSQSEGQVTHVLLTRSPLITQGQAPKITVRLACVKHAASVRPEPGSNSPLMFKPQHPKVKGKQTPKGKDSSRNRTSQTDSIPNQPNKNSTHEATKRPPHKPRSNLASIFGTLLSSQESDTHQHSAFRRHVGVTVKTTRQAAVRIIVPIRRSVPHAEPWRVSTVAGRSPLRPAWFHPGYRVVTARGTGHFARRLRTCCSGVRCSLSG
jgi:hypothetical protein